MLKFDVSRLYEFFGAVSRVMRLYLPAEGSSRFSLYTGSEKLSGALNALHPPKELFFPQSENIASFKTHCGAIEITENKPSSEKFAVFGVRACDMRAINILDSVFLSEPSDSFYKARRDAGVIITAACNSPESSCFCTVFGIDPALPGGDVSSYFCGDSVFLCANTPKGEDFLRLIDFDPVQAHENELDGFKSELERRLKALPLASLDLSYWLNTDEKELFSSEQWDKLCLGCLGCGACTFICPTCQCYDVKERVKGCVSEKYRCWDSCMYSDFTLMAHGNPRKSRKERFRQRFMHKLKYYPETHSGEFSCVGCGRCVNACPQSKNIVKTARSVAK